MSDPATKIEPEKPLLARDFVGHKRPNRPLVLYARKGVSTADRIRAAARYGCLVLVEGGKSNE